MVVSETTVAPRRVMKKRVLKKKKTTIDCKAVADAGNEVPDNVPATASGSASSREDARGNVCTKTESYRGSCFAPVRTMASDEWYCYRFFLFLCVCVLHTVPRCSETAPVLFA